MENKIKKGDKLRVLCTGVSGFVGHHVFEHIMKNTNWEIIGMHRNCRAGDLERIGELLDENPEWEDRLTMLRVDLRDDIHEQLIKRIGCVDIVLHLAANSHVDRSITDPVRFLEDNTVSTVKLLEWVRKQEPKPLFYYFSTDEVFGPAPEGVFYTEEDRHRPNNPYAAAKAASECFVEAYGNTYNIPFIISNAMNVIGERQNPEKYVPLVINKLLNNEKLLVHSSEGGSPGQRHYLHARNIAAAVQFIIENGKNKERYNIVGDKEVDNLEMALLIEKYVNEWRKDKGELPLVLDYDKVDFHSSRPGHDLRYGIDGSKLKNMGFSYPISFEESLKKVVFWTLDEQHRWL